MQVVPPGVQNWNQYRYQVIKRKWRHLLKKAKACDVVYLAIGRGDLKETFPDAQIDYPQDCLPRKCLLVGIPEVGNFE